MTATKYTEGPWSWHSDDSSIYIQAGPFAETGLVAEIENRNRFGNLSSQAEANARLISSAPELAHLLRWASEFAEGSRDLDPALDNPTFNGLLDRCRAVLIRAGQIQIA